MFNHSNTSFCLPQGKEMSYTESIFWIVISSVLVGSMILDSLLIYHKDKVNKIEKKLLLLHALTKDYHQLSKEEDQLEVLARDFWGLEDLSRIHLWLSHDKTEWVKRTEGVVNDANVCIANYKKQDRGSIRSCLTAIFRLQAIKDIICQINEFERKVENHLEMKDRVAEDIYDTMEKSRSRNRSLLKKYEIEESQDAVKSETVEAQHQKQRKPSSTSIDELMMNRDLFAGMEARWSMYLLLPLHAFTKDLSQLQLETETEKTWKSAAEELITDAVDLISKYSWWDSRLSSILISKKNIRRVTSLLFGNDIQRIVNAFDDLLDRKKKWGFDFVDRAATKSFLPRQNADDDTIASAIKSIQSKQSKLDQISKQVDKMYHKLEGMYKELQGKKETATRKACLEQLEFIAQEMDHSLSSFQERQMENPEHNCLEEIEKAMDLLQKVIETCYIRKQKSASAASFQNAVQELVCKLTRDGDNPFTISIVGMKGVGKKTLAEAIYYNKAVVKYFEVRVWVTDGAASKAQVRQMKQDRIEEQTLSITEVHNHLKGKLGLIVLDNISKTEDFDKLRNKLLPENEVSRILITTRFKNVALHAVKNSIPHQIRLLTKEESWELFQNVTSTVKPDANSNEEKLARRVVGRCGGLPHAILSVGVFMSVRGSMTEKDLWWVLDRINHGHNKTPWLQAWENTKKELDETLSKCLDYLTLFPVDFEIPVRRLVNLWLAEGLVEQQKTSDDNQEKTSEYYAEKYLEELRDCNMIQVVAMKSNGKIKTCRLPSMLREIILKSSNRTSYSQYSGTHLGRRFAYRFDDHGLDANSANVFSKKRNPQSVFYFDKREGNKPGEHIGRILSTGMASEQFMEIRVLDLERVFRPQLPKALAKLVQLKYLGLRWTYLEEFPAFIGKLLNLETLDVKHTCIRVFPSSIWRLKKLKNLYLNQDYRSRLEGKPSGNFQPNLCRLWGVFIYGKCPLLCELQKLMNLRELNLSFQLTEAEERDALGKKIVQLNQLQSLRLRSIGEMGEAKELILGNMSNLEKLSSLQLYGKLEGGLRTNKLPKNLIHLTLSASELSDDPMPLLQNLHQLESLCFYADSYKGTSMVCKPDSFPELQVLRFWNLPNLQKWEVQKGALPSLKEFEARFCKELAVPTGLENLKNLRLIKLHEMPSWKKS